MPHIKDNSIEGKKLKDECDASGKTLVVDVLSLHDFDSETIKISKLYFTNGKLYFKDNLEVVHEIAFSP